jgi:glycosyltransferase involved in cell wall biosynthesis
MPDISYIIPTRNEAAYLNRCLESIREQSTDMDIEIIVADAGSDDATQTIAKSFGATVVTEGTGTRARGRNAGAAAASGRLLAFIDADTTVAPAHAETLDGFIEDADLVGATSTVRMDSIRALPMQFTINHVLSRLPAPVLPGFNTVVENQAFDRVSGFPDVPNEDTAFSTRLADHGRTAYYREPLVTTSARRIRRLGLTGTLAYYLALDLRRLTASREATPGHTF